MKTPNLILEEAQRKASELNVAYQGALSPKDAYAVLISSADAKLVDVRCRAELDWVGRIPKATEIEWATYPGMIPHPNFISLLEQQVKKETLVLFICRTGGRSNAAATLATQAGYTHCYNIMEGFEGDKNIDGHRSTSNGWRAAKLPWMQS